MSGRYACGLATRVADSGSLVEESEQRLVDLVGVRPADVVRAALDRDQLQVVDQCRQPLRGRLEGQDPIFRAVNDQRGHIDLRQVIAEVGQPGVDTRVGRIRRSARGQVEARLPGLVADSRPAELVDVVEVVEEVLENRRSGP